MKLACDEPCVHKSAPFSTYINDFDMLDHLPAALMGALYKRDHQK
jgi:hypothetical protein